MGGVITATDSSEDGVEVCWEDDPEADEIERVLEVEDKDIGLEPDDERGTTPMVSGMR